MLVACKRTRKLTDCQHPNQLTPWEWTTTFYYILYPSVTVVILHRREWLIRHFFYPWFFYNLLCHHDAHSDSLEQLTALTGKIDVSDYQPPRCWCSYCTVAGDDNGSHVLFHHTQQKEEKGRERGGTVLRRTQACGEGSTSRWVSRKDGTSRAAQASPRWTQQRSDARGISGLLGATLCARRKVESLCSSWRVGLENERCRDFWAPECVTSRNGPMGKGLRRIGKSPSWNDWQGLSRLFPLWSGLGRFCRREKAYPRFYGIPREACVRDGGRQEWKHQNHWPKAR